MYSVINNNVLHLGFIIYSSWELLKIRHTNLSFFTKQNNKQTKKLNMVI